MEIKKFRKIACILSILYTSSILCSGKNLAPNPSFELIENGDLPKSYNNCIISKKAPHSGSNSILQTYKRGNSWNTVQSLAPFIKVDPKKHYLLKVWNKNTVPSGDIAFGLRFINKNLKSISYRWKSVNLNSQENWTECSLLFQPPPETAFVSIYFKVGIDVETGEVYWDDISLTETLPTRKYLDVKALKSTVFFKKGKQFADNFIFYKDRKQFVNILPSSIKLDIHVSNVEKGENVLIYELMRKYFSKILLNKSYKIKSSRQNIIINPKIEDLAKGYYSVRIKLLNKRDKKETVLAKWEKEISVLDYQDFPKLEPAKKVTITNNSLKVNGKPFIPICFYHPALTSEYFQMIGQFGENVKQLWSDAPGGIENNISNFKQLLDLCMENNSYAFIVMHTSWALDRKKKKYKLENIRKMVNALKEHPAVLMWSITDEPDAMKIPPEEVAKVYKLIKSLDSNHPVWVNLCYPNKFKDYSPYTDIASYDHYPNPYETLMTVYKWNKLVLEASKYNKPLLAVLQTYSRPGTKLPSYKWLKAQTYLSICQGMKMFFYYTFNDPEPSGSLSLDTELQSHVKELNHEIVSISEVINSESVKIPAIEDLRNRGIIYSFRKVKNHKYLITVNTSNKKVMNEFSIPEYENEQKVETLFEDGRMPKLTNGRLVDKFEPYQVHIYKY